MNNIPENLRMVFALIWNALQYTFYFGNKPFTLWDIMTCGFIVTIFGEFLSHIVLFWEGIKVKKKK